MFPSAFAGKPDTLVANHYLKMGDVILCRDEIADASLSDVALSLLLTVSGRELVATETAKHVSKNLAFRLGDQVIMDIQVHEPITGGSLQIYSGSREVLRRMLRAVQISCPHAER
jgi:hypothetical protein